MKLGEIELDNDLIWTDEFLHTEGVGTAERTLYGNLIVQTRGITGGRPMTLVGESNNGWQSRTTVLALQALVNQDPGATHTVELPDGRTFSVMFRNDEPPVLEFSPITLASAPTANFWYYGTVKLRIIS